MLHLQGIKYTLSLIFKSNSINIYWVVYYTPNTMLSAGEKKHRFGFSYLSPSLSLQPTHIIRWWKTPVGSTTYPHLLHTWLKFILMDSKLRIQINTNYEKEFTKICFSVGHSSLRGKIFLVCIMKEDPFSMLLAKLSIILMSSK